MHETIAGAGRRGRSLAALIPDAQLVLLESSNHILLSDEPAWQSFLSEVRRFLGSSSTPTGTGTAVDDLSARELEVLELVAAGLTNEEIATRLCLSIRTIERHLEHLREARGVGEVGASGRRGEVLSDGLIRLRVDRRRAGPRMGGSPDVRALEALYRQRGLHSLSIRRSPVERTLTVDHATPRNGGPIATYEVSGGEGTRLHAVNGETASDLRSCSFTVGRKVSCVGPAKSTAISQTAFTSSRSTTAVTVCPRSPLAARAIPTRDSGG